MKTPAPTYQITIDAARELANLRMALRAIQARVEGEFDHPSLNWFGPLSTSTTDDVLVITRLVLGPAVKLTNNWEVV